MSHRLPLSPVVVAMFLAVLSSTASHALPSPALDSIPTPTDSLPFDIRTCVGIPEAVGSCPEVVCPGVSVPFTVAGAFPTGCYQVRGFEWLPLGAPFDVAQLEVVRCGDACPPALEPFRATLMVPPAVPGEHRFQLRVVQRDCSDSSVVEATWNATVRYLVSEQCPEPGGCVFPFMTSASGHPCAATISPNGDATVDFTLHRSITVAGLEGQIEVQEPLVVAGVEAIGAASGMRALWERTEHGARWALLGFEGQQLPVGSDERVLRVKLQVPTDGPLPARMRVAVTVEVASDSLGGKVPICDISTMRFADPAAIVCARRSCDLNQDGRENVRDLVAMVYCLRQPGVCPDSLPPPDCNADGRFDVDDVLCCARRILRGAGADTLPPRPGDGIAVRFGSAIRTATGIDLPLALQGRETLGDARLVLTFPADRFEFAAAAFEGDETGWLALAESSAPGRVTLALVNVGGVERELPWRLALRLKPGAQAAGTVSVDAARLSGADGATLTTTISGTTSPALAEATALPAGLSAARPNPFGGSTRFAVTLAAAGDVDLSVHDLAGRRVVTLHRGRLPAGSRDFLWTGRGETGARSPDGVYFVHLRVDGQTSSRRVALLGAR